jgi:DNA-binding transcriptional regulator YhcF (GntR family)
LLGFTSRFVVEGFVDQPPYRQIAAEYRAQIQNGTLQPGERLPTVRAMAAEWGVNRVTASKAVVLLRDEGLVVTAGRNGTMVTWDQQMLLESQTVNVDPRRLVALVVPEGKALLVRLIDA